MVIAHTAMLDSGNALAKKLNITPDPAAADSIDEMSRPTGVALRAAPQGAAFDSAYVNAQVPGHQYVLDMIKRDESAARNANLKSALTSAEPKVQAHLDRIRTIQGKLK
jgi:predicted outer membrane protein